MNPLFSVITITYNAAQWIERTIDSVSSQTIRDRIEYIVIDGASKDGTVEILNRRREDIHVLVSEPDKGLYDAMNKGLQRASGEYVWFMNAGDTIRDTNTAEQLMKVVAENQFPDIIYGETALVDAEGQFLRMRRLKAPDSLNWKSFTNGMLVCHQSFIVKRVVATPYDLGYRLSSDVDWCIRAMKAAHSIVNSRIIITNYLEEGLSTSNRKKSLKERYAIMSNHYGKIPTFLRHIWFALRFSFAKYISGEV